MPDAPRPSQSASKSGLRVITDLETVERRARDLAGENMKFRSWAKFRTSLSGEELDNLVCAVTDAVWRQIDCTACGNCCRVLSIALDEEDVARLAKRLGLSSDDFARRYVQGEGEQRSFALQPCPFLSDNACSVYEDRPKACREFPYLHSEGFRHRMLGLIEFSFLCPVVFNTFQVLKRRLPWRRQGGRRGK